VIDTLLKNKVVNNKDLVVLTKGSYQEGAGGTNMMKILRVGDQSY
jgi:pyruvate kinase